MKEKNEENYRSNIFKRLWYVVLDLVNRDPVRMIGFGILLTATIVILILSIIFPPVFAIIPAAALISSPALAAGLTSLLVAVFGGIAMVLWNFAYDVMKMLFPPRDVPKIEKAGVKEDVPVVTNTKSESTNKSTENTLISSEALSPEEKALEEEIEKLSQEGKKVENEISAKITEGKQDEAIHLMKEQLTQLSASYKKFALLCHSDKVSEDRKAWAERVFKTLVEIRDSFKTNWELASVGLSSDLNESSKALREEWDEVKKLFESFVKSTDELQKKVDIFSKKQQEMMEKVNKMELKFNKMRNDFSVNRLEPAKENQSDFWSSKKPTTPHSAIEAIKKTVLLIEKNAADLISSNTLDESMWEEEKVKRCITLGYVGRQIQFIQKQAEKINAELKEESPDETYITTVLNKIEKAAYNIQDMVPWFEPEVSTIRKKTKEIRVYLNLNEGESVDFEEDIPERERSRGVAREAMQQIEFVMKNIKSQLNEKQSRDFAINFQVIEKEVRKINRTILPVTGFAVDDMRHRSLPPTKNPTLKDERLGARIIGVAVFIAALKTIEKKISESLQIIPSYNVEFSMIQQEIQKIKDVLIDPRAQKNQNNNPELKNTPF